MKSKMKRNVLGDTGMSLSHVGLGGAAFSNIYGKFDEARSIELIRASLEAGINYIDTGPWYGQGSSETTIGKALQGVCRESYYIGSKVGRYELEVEKMFDFSAEKCHSSVELSLERLGLDYVDIIQVHDLTFAPDVSLVVRETLPALAREVAQGRARHIGLADYDLGLLRDVVEESEVKIASVLSYARCTLIDNSLQKYIDFFQRNGVGVINAAGNAMGLLTNSGPPPWHPASQEVKEICRRAADYCKGEGVELARLAQYAALQQHGGGGGAVTTHVLGLQQRAHLDQLLDMLRAGLTERERRALAHVQTLFDGKTMHWENVELPIYQQKLKAKLKMLQ